MAREFNIKTLSGTASISDLHYTVTTAFQNLLSDFTYSELLESDDLNGLLSDANVVAEDEDAVLISSFGNMQPAGGIKSVLVFGAKSDDTGKFLIANGKSSDADDSSKTKTRFPSAATGTITKIAYQTKDGDTTTVMKIHINGVVEETITLSSMDGSGRGTETTTTTMVEGQVAEIEYDSGQKPGECIMTLTVE